MATQLFGAQILDVIEEKPKKKKSELFEMIKMMFEQPSKFAELSIHEKSKHFFMMNRFFSIKFPIQAQMFNHLKISPGHVIQIWADMLRPLYNSTPSFIFNAIRNTKKKKKEKIVHKIEESTISYYAQRFMLSERDVNFAIDTLGKPFISELMLIQKALSKTIK